MDDLTTYKESDFVRMSGKYLQILSSKKIPRGNYWVDFGMAMIPDDILSDGVLGPYYLRVQWAPLMTEI